MIKLILTTCILLTSLSGCILVPAVDSARKAGLTKLGRQEALESRLREFHNALFWGRFNSAVAFATPENESVLRNQFRNNQGKRRVVDSKVEYINFDEDAYKADVEMELRYHNLATNIVTPARKFEEWQFSVSDGWRIVAMTENPIEQG